jgi:hypothetical protein
MEYAIAFTQEIDFVTVFIARTVGISLINGAMTTMERQKVNV